MKNKPSTFLKQIFSFLTTIIKTKVMSMKNKTNAIKARLLIFNLLRNKKVLMSTINHKIHAIMGENYSKAIVLYNNNATKKRSPGTSEMKDVELNEEDEEDEEDDYPDLRHSLFELEDEDEDEDEDDELVNGTGSVIDFVRNSREDDNGFNLEDEIDHAADVFIRRFHRQMKIQKQESFKRYKEMLARGV